jgi:hypothetical protein
MLQQYKNSIPSKVILIDSATGIPDPEEAAIHRITW